MSQATNIDFAGHRARGAESSAGAEDVAPNLPAGLVGGLRNYWYPVLQSENIEAGKAVGLKVLGEDLVAWRGPNGGLNVVHDRCPHRSIKLSVGRDLDGQLQCI
jgi:hypothetical protein